MNSSEKAKIGLHGRLALVATVLAIVGINSSFGQLSLGTNTPILSAVASPGAFPIVHEHRAASILVAPSDSPAVQRAAGDLRDDIERVSGSKPKLLEAASGVKAPIIIVGTVGQSKWIDQLARTHKIDVEAIRGKWESFQISVVNDPLPGVAQAMVIAGSDRRGTVYGIYECSEEAGVSPWYWWADVPVKHHSALYAKPGVFTQGPPAVKYRGIFINDEDPALSGWSREKFGGVNSKMYAHMFELLLRLRANFLWPAMWGKAFNEDDPLDPQVADEYGIVMGTSHHEPMMRAQREWSSHHRDFGNGQWNYVTNGAGLREFWKEGVTRNLNYENIYTLGMRGDGDKAMPDAGGFEANQHLLEGIIQDQRMILQHEVNPDLTKIPQLWAIFTEVQQYYDAGMKVPDDVTLLFTDDNVGHIRRVPTAAERNRSGGAGVYFHMDMNGGPFSYKWLNSNPLPRIWEQMNLAYSYGADRIWIANVGDLKPLEVPMEFFLRMGWDPHQFGPDSIQPYLQRWAEREFGQEHAAEIADIVAKYAKYNNSPKPELVRTNTFSLTQYREAERVYNRWSELMERAAALKRLIPADQQDAYYELVLHPVLACGNAVQLHIVAGRNNLFVTQGRVSANSDAELTEQLYQRDQELTAYFNKVLARGKWDHMMDQVHLGYTGWASPRENSMPAVQRINPMAGAAFGVAVEGSESAWPEKNELELSAFDSLNASPHYFEVFQKGSTPEKVRVETGAPWIHLREGSPFSSGTGDQRYWVTVDWTKLPPGASESRIQVMGTSAQAVLKVRAVKASAEQERAADGAYAALAGQIAFDAVHTSARKKVNGVQWVNVPDDGREGSSVTVLPVTANSFAPAAPSPTLEYNVFWPNTGTLDVDLVTTPTLDIYPDSHLAVAVSFDDNKPDVESVFTDATRKSETFLGHNFGQNDRANARVMHFQVNVPAGGRHVLRIHMIDPTLVIEKVVLHDGNLPSSFFGPPVQQAYRRIGRAD